MVLVLVLVLLLSPTADGVGDRCARAMRWNNTSGFVLRRMAQLISDGSRPDKVFKDKDVNHMAKAFKEYSGEAVAQLRCTTF
jgi:hypothetical protein